MGRRRWRFVTIAAFLLFMIKDTQCQDDNEYYTPQVERSFAQVQPSIFPNSRPTTFFEYGDSFRVAPPQQPLYNEGHVRFPSPNYNQNPSPFQLPTGRSQSGAQYYVNQPDFTASQRQRFRPALPFNFQLVNAATTKRPDVSQIHSVAYQNDPSKPETFLGQITLNNPDIDYLQHNKYKNIPFDSNSLKSNGQSGHINRDEDIEENQDLLDHPRVTTYNPNKLVNKQRLNTRPGGLRLTHHDASIEQRGNFQNIHSKLQDNKVSKTGSVSNENKALLDLEPLLEDEISDMNSFRELMKNPQKSHDVQVIKSNVSEVADSSEDNKPDASSMNADNQPNIPARVIKPAISKPTYSFTDAPTQLTEEPHRVEEEETSGEEHAHSGEAGEEEYEYYDETESSDALHHTTSVPSRSESTEHVTDIYDEYDGTDEPEMSTDEPKSHVTESFDVVMKAGNVTVKEDNFKHFVDTPIIDQSEQVSNTSTLSRNKNTLDSVEDVTSIETPSILGEEVVSVVTTKSVVNGTISIPDVTFAPSTTKLGALPDTSLENSQDNDTSLPVTTENWIVVASVQTSRSVSGARFLPFPTVEQDIKKQVLADEDEEDEDDDETTTKDPRQETSGLISSSSTENINDKLDSIQSELSSAVLSGSLDNEDKNIKHITETTTEATSTSTVTVSTTSSTTTTTPGTLNVFTLKSTQTPSVSEKSSPEPPPVLIKKFTHRASTSTTPKPKNKKPSFVTVMDDLPPGFLPAGYKPRSSFKDRRSSTTPSTTTSTTTTTTTTPMPPSSTEDADNMNGTQGRSSGISSKNKVILLDDKSLLPKEYKPKEKTPEDLIRKFQKDDVNKFLPPGYKPPTTEESKPSSTSKPDILDKVQQVDISAFLPKGFKLNETSTQKPKTAPKIPIVAKPVDISAFLPPGFKLNETKNDSSNSDEVKSDDLISKFKIADISSFLPPGLKLNNTEEEETEPQTVTTKVPGSFKVVFPRPSNKNARKSTPKPLHGSGPSPVTPAIKKGWPTRASTEFTGWPSSSTTPFSIEKYLNKDISIPTPASESSTEITTRRMTTTTTTTQAPPPPTTPGVCKQECDIAATIKIVSGVNWVPELLDHHTDEWQRLAKEVKTELNSVYSKSDLLKKWYKGIRIDGFSQGSVLVDYFVELNNVDEKVNTLELKKLFHKSLHEAPPGSVVETIQDESDEEFNPDVMLGDQPDEERMKKSNEKMTKTIDKSAGKLEIGKFVMDPAYTEFIVLPKREEPKHVESEEESFLPQWGIAVIVIAMASLLFVVIFGVTVLVNRQKSAKAKQPIPLSEDMLRELDKNHMGGFDDMHQMKEREVPYASSGKRMSTAFIEQLAYPNPGDSWRSEWTPQLQKYMQHYTPDSGRGSQIYGASGNGYGYGGGGGSQLYGQTGGGSQIYGYTGEYPTRSHYSRRRSYDNNF